MPQNLYGCDLSKAAIDIHDHAGGRDFQIPNTPDAIGDWLARLPVGGRVVLEATSGCDRALLAGLARAKITHHRLNPRQVRDFARATGVLAKTDRVDARVLAEMGHRLDLPATVPPDPARLRLAAHIKRREQLVTMRQAERQRRAETADAAIAAEIATMIGLMTKRIARLEARIARLTEGDTALAPEARRLRSMPGVGPVGAAVLLADLPELGHRARRPLASLAGVAPMARDSGTMRGRRTIWGGRRRVRRVLYIAALNAIRNTPRFKDAYRRMRDKGKAAKTALIAIARRILVILNAMIKSRKDFDPNYL